MYSRLAGRNRPYLGEREGVNKTSVFYDAIGVFFRVWLDLFCPVTVVGGENLPREGGYIIAADHQSGGDPIVLSALHHPPPIHWLAKTQLYSSRLGALTMRVVMSIPLDRDHPGPSTFRALKEIVGGGGVVGIFPEGTRRKKGSSTELKDGVAFIATLTRAPIVPVSVRWRWVPMFGGVHIAIGSPIEVPEIQGFAKSERALIQVALITKFEEELRSLERAH